MITEVTMPAMGADMTEGTVVKWLKQEGDEVQRGERLAEIETDKAVVDMEAYGEGVLRRIVVGEGEKVPVGELIAFIGAHDDPLPEVAAPAMAAASPEAPAVATPSDAQAALAATAPPTAAGGRIKASPVARKLAEERGINLSLIPGTGPGGRITRQDVEGFSPAAATAPEAAAPVRPGAQAGPLSSMRQAIARVTVRSKSTVPHFYVTAAVDMTAAMSLRQQINQSLAGDEGRVSVNDMIIKSSALALARYPKFNSFFEDDRLIGHAGINVGIAIALDAGLIVPALMGCQERSLKDISVAAKDLGRRARGQGGSLSQEENSGGTFSISNLGMFDVESFSAIILPPQSAVLATGRVAETPVVRDGEVTVAEMMKATLSVDHRVADGAEAAVFLGEIKSLLENPMRLLL